MAMVCVSKTNGTTVGYVRSGAFKSGQNERIVGADFEICQNASISKGAGRREQDQEQEKGIRTG